jgi:hypothetical protein
MCFPVDVHYKAERVSCPGRASAQYLVPRAAEDGLPQGLRCCTHRHSQGTHCHGMSDQSAAALATCQAVRPEGALALEMEREREIAREREIERERER